MAISTITTFDTVGYLVIGVTLLAFPILLASLILHLGGSRNFYAALHFLSIATMFFYACIYELFVSTFVICLYVLAYVMTFLYVAIAKSYAQEAGILR